MDRSGIDTHWNFDDPAASERAFRELLNGALASGNTALRTELLTQIARAQGLQGAFEAARSTLDEAATLVPYAGHRARIRHLLETGRLLNSAGDPAGAAPFFSEAWTLARESGDDALAVDAAHMLGIATPPREQLTWTLRALDLAESSTRPDARRWSGPLLNNLGWTYHDLGDFPNALATFERAREWQAGSGSRSGELFASYAIGRALRSLGWYDEAVTIQHAVLGGAGDGAGPGGFAAEELAELYLVLGRPDEAALYAARGAEALAADPWISTREPDRLARLRQLAGGPPGASETTRP